jgi:threonine synthase
MKVVAPFIGDEIPQATLRDIITSSYAEFAHADIAPLKQLAEGEFVLELFHGPTLAFKDFALQVLGRMLDYVLKKNNQRVVILGATSGDTGSAALEGCRHSDNVEIFILHPHNRVSDVQRKQMTTIIADNVHNLAVEGNFDDCQRIVKAAFADQSFLPGGRQLVAVNSINWARILMQIVYYFSASLRLGGPEKQVSFSVPTGNFGDIYAGYLARHMGLPIDQLVVATNTNDILHRFISGNDYAATGLVKTLSPSMDILVSSNFERYLFDLFDRDPKQLREFMADAGTPSLSVSPEKWQQVGAEFSSARVDDETTCEVISSVFKATGELLDPHTAIGVQAARWCRTNSTVPMVTLATAHPAKFSDAIVKAGLATPPLPGHLKDLFNKEEKYTVVENDLAAVTAYVASHCQSST